MGKTKQKQLLKNINFIKNKVNDDIIVMFSTGKDATVTLDLLCKDFPAERLHVVYMYCVKDLSFKNSILNYYERRYGITIDRFPHYELTKILKKHYNKKYYTGRNITASDFQRFLREKYDTSWIAYGYRITESIERMQMIRAEAPSGVDFRNKKIYPVADFNEKEIMAYVKRFKLPLTIEYSYNYRDIGVPFGEILNWLWMHYPEDYQRAIEQFPFLEAELVRYQNDEN